MKITRELLVEHNACNSGVQAFLRLFPDGLDVPDDMAERSALATRASAAGLDVYFCVRAFALTVAYLRADGTQAWYRDGKQHRDDGPALIYADGTQAWYRDGKLHRDDGPALIYADGTQAWYRDGKQHRDDGPALIYADGTQFWCRHDKLHRDDGPAAIYANGRKEWWTNDKLVR